MPDPRRRDESARERILQAAREMLGEVGFAALTVEGVAARAHVGKQTVYRWWRSKSEVVLEAVTATTGEAAPDLPDTGDLATDLTAVLRAVVEELADPVTDLLQRTLVAEIQHDPVLAARLVESILRPQVASVAARIRRGQEVGQADPASDPDLVAELLLGPVFHRWLLRTAPLDDAYAAAVVRAVLDGVGTPPR